MLQPSTTKPASGKFFYGWTIVGLSSYMMFLVSGVVFAFGIFFPSFEAEFGWSRSQISLTISFNMLVYGVAQLLVGGFMQRYGVRRVLVASVCFTGIGLLMMSQVQSLWHLYLYYGVLIGVGYGSSGIVAQSVIASRWFARRLGVALSIIFAGIGAGQLILFPLIMRSIVNHGWSATYAGMGAGFLVLILPLLLLLMKDEPQDVGTDLDGGALQPSAIEAAQERSIGLFEAWRTQPFWMLLLGFVICGFTWSMMVAHFVVMAIDLGFSRQFAAFSMGLISAVSVVGMLISGPISDRIGRRIPLCLGYAIRGAGMLYLTTVHDFVGLMVFIVLFGSTFTLTVPLTSSYVRDLFGRLSVGPIFGFIAGVHQIGAILGPAFAGYVYDRTGSYNVALYVSAALLLGATLVIIFLRDVKPGALPSPAVTSS